MRMEMRALAAGATMAALAALAGPATAHDGVEETRKLEFPALPDGRFVLPVDLHTHSVFSDGMVWPDIRVEEAKRDALFAMAVSEHLEYQPKAKDIPHADRNRSFQVATDAAAVKPDATGADARPLMVINGSEITKLTIANGGHMNAVFLTDANALNGLADARKQLEAANAQGAFTFWNHPYWHAQRPNGVAELTPKHAEYIKAGLLHGIEVVNGADFSEEAFKIALDNNLTVMGTSDIHGLIDWDYDLANGGHRTATLVLTKSATADGLKAALKAGDTVAIYNDSLIGRPANVEAVARASLKVEAGDYMGSTRMVPVMFTNTSPVDFLIESTGGQGFYDEARVFTVKGHSSFTVMVPNVQDKANLRLTLKLLNTWVAPKEHLSIEVAPK